MLSCMFQHGYLDTYCFERLIICAHVYSCICSCSAQLSMFHMERHSRNFYTLIIIIIVVVVVFVIINNYYYCVVYCVVTCFAGIHNNNNNNNNDFISMALYHVKHAQLR